MVILKDLLYTLPPNTNVCLISFENPNRFLCTVPVGSELLEPFKDMEVRYTDITFAKRADVGCIHMAADLVLRIREPIIIDDKEDV